MCLQSPLVSRIKSTKETDLPWQSVRRAVLRVFDEMTLRVHDEYLNALVKLSVLAVTLKHQRLSFLGIERGAHSGQILVRVFVFPCGPSWYSVSQICSSSPGLTCRFGSSQCPCCASLMPRALTWPGLVHERMANNERLLRENRLSEADRDPCTILVNVMLDGATYWTVRSVRRSETPTSARKLERAEVDGR